MFLGSMLSRKYQLSIVLATFVLFSTSAIVAAGNYRSNIWHEGPINCYTCLGEEECSNGIGAIQKCENNDEQVCVTVFNEDGGVIQRGCSDKIPASQYSAYCNENGEKCPTCSSSGCNDATHLDQYTECFICDSSLDKNCVLNPMDITTKVICNGGCMTALYPTSNASSPNYNLVRSCLNDKDMDDQANCLNGINKNCVGCTNEANCNTASLPEVRHSCYRCLGAACEDPEPEECIAFNENDQCFTRFESGNNDVVELGCLSDFDSEEAIIELVKKKSLLTCNGVNCNGFENLPKQFDCSRCSSIDEVSCATDPTTITTVTKCATMPYTQCYQRIRGDATERGCLSELNSDDFYNCLTGADENCKICAGNICNEEIIPNDRLTCHRCDSDSDPSCHNSPAASSVCPSYKENDGCVAVYENGRTKRGCQSEFQCDANSMNCQLCSSDNCNTANIKKRVDEIYGIFQDLPLNCNTCSGDECQTGARNPRKCEGDIYQDCMTVFDTNGLVIRRGCENVILEEHETHCNEIPELCFKCKSNGCNDITDHQQSQECLYCDASTNPDCLFNPSAITTTRQCALGCVSSLYPRKTDPTVYDFVRTCFEDIEFDDRDKCDNADNCAKCSNNKCNTVILPEEGRLSCYHCETENCDTPQPHQCQGYATNDQCYMYFDNTTYSVVRMGCRSEFTLSEILAEAKQFFVCDGDNCNTYENLPEAKFCYTCDSASDINCAIQPSLVTNLSRCQIYPYTECYTRVRNDGHTERGCLYSLELDDFLSCNNGESDSKCRICADSECNQSIYPSSRQQCYRCDSTNDDKCEGDAQLIQACPVFYEDDECVTQWIDGITRRGCSSEFTCEGLGRKRCLQCSDNACNHINLAEQDIGPVGVFTDLPLSCYHCNGTEDCQESKGSFRVCVGNDQQTCTVAFNAEGNVIERGCSDVVDRTCEAAGNICYDCKSPGCNSAVSEADYTDCIYCDSQNNDDCISDVSAITRTRKCYKSCMTTLYPRTRDENPVYELMRTCLDDKELDDRDICESSNDPKCKSCTGDRCNKDAIGIRRSCYQCKGDECQTAQPITCRAVMDNDQCFVQFDESGSITELGCKSKYNPLEVETLVKAQYLWLCDDDNCNSIDNVPQSQTCILCSSLSDGDCATNPKEVETYTTCNSLPYTKCYSRVLNSGHTERGCLSNLEDEQFYNCLYNTNSTECLSCEGMDCNNQIYPSDRATCHICSSEDYDACEFSPNSPEICLKYDTNEKCVTTINKDGFTIRGCHSQLTCDSSDPSSCHVCEGNDCNTINLKRKSDGKPGQWQSLPLTCFTCTSVDDCKSRNTPLTCNGNDYCMTVFNSDGEVVTRGCSSDVEQDQGSFCDMNSGNCFNCNSNLCNSASALNDYNDCVYCDSETNSNCALNPEVVKTRRKCNGNCMTALYSAANNSIYEVVRSCLDDKDEPDQNICSSGSSNECKACSGPSCNIEILPENRLSCYSCTGESCVDPEPSVCLRYKSDDQCFMLFDDRSDLIKMGCVSDLEDSFVSNNIHRLYMCSSENNCNSFENIPKATMCAVCNSNDDPDCASLPQNIPSLTQCTVLPNTQCYTKVNTDGSTQRGCVSSLNQAQMLSCISGTSSDCSSCEGDRCNIQIFPSDRRRCQRCNTKDDPGCEASPNASSVCPVFDNTQFCATKLVNGHTYRGCSNEFQCDDTDKQYCRHCYHSNDCNNVDLVSSNIGFPGKWQDVPINCYNCQDSDCQGSSVGSIGKCENNNQQNCGTVFASNGSVVFRGCSDSIYNSEYLDYCDENPSFCKFCKSSGCNNAFNVADYQDCLYCDGLENTDCIFHPENIQRTRSCHKGCMTALYPRSDEDNPAFELSRGCLDDLDLDDREECLEGSMQNCHACQDPMCNVVKIPENRQKCNFCIGMDCEEPKSMECTAFRENEQCFTLFADENNVQRMGCVSDLDNAFLVGNRRNLLVCDGDNCNNFDNFPKQIACRWCNSSVDPECSSNPISVIATVCHLFPNTECFTRIDKDGVTHRGCLSDVNDELYDECMSGINGCEICSTNDCNNQIFPEGRRSCIRCDSALFSACEDNSIQFAETCPLFKDNDSCVTKLEGDRITRGCTSEFTCDTSDRDTCRICNSTDNCNTVNLLNAYIGVPGKWQGLPLNCYTCEGDECINSNGVVNVCNGNNLQTCTVVFGLTGAVEKRGCSDAITSSHNDYCDQYPERCIHCKSNGCNTANSLDEYNDCYYCDSANSASCSVNFDTSIGRTRKCHGDCMVALYPRNSGNDPAYELTRTCLDDMDMDDRELCSNGENDFCQSCTGARCNTMNVPETRFECFTCADNDCEDMELRECRAYHPNDQCYTLFSNESNVIAMGCRSEYEMDTVLELVKQKQMLLCNEKGCNSPDAIPTMKSCSVCNSEDNALCAINPNLVANVQRCSSLPYTECFTRINIYGHTERGCLSGLTDPDIFYGCLIGSDGLCETCMGDKCNEIDVYPADRRTCHQCSSTSDPLCGTSPNSNKVCALYAENDSCISNYRNGVTTRGCGSSMTCDNVNDLRTCRICNTNGCNTVNFEKVNENGKPGLWQDVPITCYTCQGEEDCQSKGDFRVCVNNPYQNCMSIFNDEGKVIQRGCSDSLEAQNEAYCEENPGNCMACNSNGCNIATRLEEYVDCLSCESDSSGNCVSNIASIDKTRKCYKYCMTALYPIFREENPSYGLVRSCYDDMDLDDRESCAAGTKDHCQTCNSDKCNTDIVPAERHSCYICEGDECQNPTIQECPNYRPDDKCYIRFDEKLSIIALGCRSEFSNQEADYLLKQKLIHLCEDDNCNHFDNLPSSQVCTLCNSRTDKDCAVNPEQVFGQTTCATLPFTECYSRVLPDGATERGCLSNLYDNEFLTCLDGSSTTCKSCKDNNCNKDIFPVNRLKCHICDSSVDGYCENSPNSLEICPLYDVEDMCVTKIRNDITYRGCSSSLVCDATNPRKCVKCAGEGCNTVNLAKKQDDNYGKWQDLPLTCLSCENSNCESPELVTCDLNNEQDCVTIFNENGSVIRRGCADEVEKEFGKYCDENEGNCFNCKSNECNSAVSKSEFTECIYCDSTKDLNCLWNPLSSDYKLRQCQGGCMTALYPSDSSSNPAYDLIRTCLNDKEVTDQSACSSGKDAKCEACTADKCNVNNIPENRLSCYMCEGFNCEDPEIKSCPLFKEADQCFIRFDDTNSVSEMGCVSSFRNQQLESIIKTKRVSVCSGDNCNTLDSIPAAQRCAVCDSVNEASCAVSPVEIGSFNSCNIFPYTGCYTKLTENGHTERGCLTDLLENEFVDCVLGNNKNCGTCTGDGCNREIFPVDRQQCFTCTSEEEPDCESFPTSKMACPIVSDTESCMTALSGNVTIRGCKSDIFCDASDVSTCRSCFGTECNSIDLYNKWDDGYHGMWQVLPLQCHTCVGEQCLYSLGPAITCSSRNINQDCMTVFNSLGEVDRRGCSDDVEDYKDLYCRQNPELCFRCKSNECNSAWSVSEYVDCAFCDSSKNISCAIEPTDSGFGSRKCYKQCMVAMRDQQVIRSCLDDKELRVQQDCNGGSECAMCTGEYCNTFVFPKDRLKCHVCDGESCNNSFGQYCYIYDNNDYCFAKYENGRPDLLGCVSSQNASDIVEWTEQNKLHKCKGNDCNELSRLPPTTECLACDSNKTPQCSQNPLGVTTAETCNSPNDQCVTYINLEGHTIRGCLSKLNESEQSCIGAGTCAACAGSKCNKEVFPINRLSCHICNSVADEYCATSPYNPLICLVYDANDSCVTSFGADGVVTRGCSSQVVCGDSDQCEICHTDNCNTIPLKDSATSVRVGAIWILLMAFATILMGPNRL